jgi:hypothetical protein
MQGIRFGAETTRGGLLIHALVGYACEYIPMYSLIRLAPNLDCKQMREFVKELDAIDRDAVTWKEIWKTEKIFMRREIIKSWWQPARWVEYWQGVQVASKARTKHDNLVARRRLIMTELAIRCYVAAGNQPPRNLAQLVPDYLKSVPQDPFTGKPLTYRAQETNWVLYSVGPDRVDSGGTPAKKATSTTPASGDLFYDSR